MPDTVLHTTPTRAAPPPVPATQPQWILPEPGPSVEEIRLFRKRRLAASLRLFAHYGFDHGPAGHITVRDPEWTDHFWINPLGMYFGHVSVSDLLLVNHDGAIVIGDKPVNLAGFQIHSAIHKARPDVIGVAHSHSTYGKAWSTLGRPIDALTQDSAFFFGKQALSDFTGIVLESDQAQKIVADIGDSNYVILKNHGLLTMAADPDGLPGEPVRDRVPGALERHHRQVVHLPGDSQGRGERRRARSARLQ